VRIFEKKLGKHMTILVDAGSLLDFRLAITGTDPNRPDDTKHIQLTAEAARFLIEMHDTNEEAFLPSPPPKS